MLETFLAEDCDYCSNILLPSYPVGMHTEVFSFEALEKAFQNASSELEREHVTPYIYRNPEIFKLKNVKYKKNLSNIRLTLDYEEDFIVISKIFKHFKSYDYFSLDDILNFLENNPDVIKINSHFKRRNSLVAMIGIVGGNGFLGKRLSKFLLKKRIVHKTIGRKNCDLKIDFFNDNPDQFKI